MEVMTFDEVDYVKFTHAEEMTFAKLVTSALADPKVDGDRYGFLRRNIYKRKSEGIDITTEDMVLTIDILEHYGYEINSDMFVLDGKRHIGTRKSKDGTMYTMEQYITGVRIELILIWKDIWKSMRGDLIKVADEFQRFPGERVLENLRLEHFPPDEEKMILQAEATELAFMERVKRVMREQNVSEEEAIIEVSDYMPRGVFPT